MAPPDSQRSSIHYREDQYGGEIGADQRPSQTSRHKSAASLGTPKEDQNGQPCQKFNCERCKRSVYPVPDTVPDCKTHLVAFALFIIGLPFCCFLPYCFDCCGKKVDRCPRCGAYMKNTNTNTTSGPSAAR